MIDILGCSKDPETAHPIVVNGSAVGELPHDLYIPPDALEVFLENFEGPLDLLLYLIKRQNIDILEIPVAKITEQYMEYIRMMGQMRIELAAEYLLMAALLTEIKSRMLLPRPIDSDDEDDEDPRADLIRRLQEYERFRQAAQTLDQMPRCERDIYPARVDISRIGMTRLQPEVAMHEILIAFQDVLNRAERLGCHHIQKEPLSMRERMSTVLACLQTSKRISFSQLFRSNEGKAGAVVAFLAVLELTKDGLIELIQKKPLAELFLKAVKS